MPLNKRHVTFEQGKQLSEKWGGIPFFEVSAKEQINNIECFYEVIRQLRKLQPSSSSSLNNKSSNNSKKKKDNNSTCCCCHIL